MPNLVPLPQPPHPNSGLKANYRNEAGSIDWHKVIGKINLFTATSDERNGIESQRLSVPNPVGSQRQKKRAASRFTPKIADFGHS